MYKSLKHPLPRLKQTPAATGAETAVPIQAGSLMPPVIGFKASAPVQMAGESTDAKKEAKIASALTWASTSKISSLSVKQLQKSLGISETGFYDEETASAVYGLQTGWGIKDPDGRAGKTTFARLGLVFTKESKASTYGTGFWNEFLDETGTVRPQFTNGISVAVYPHYTNQSNNNQEFLRQAGPWAKRYQAIGVDESGGLKTGVPIPIKSTGEVIEKVNSITTGLTQLLIDNFFQSGTSGFQLHTGKVKNLGIFAHGMPYGLSLEEDESYALLSQDRGKSRKANIESFVQGLSGSLAPGVNVQLFACNTGREFNEKKPLEKEKYEHWQVSAKGGANSFGALLSRQLGQDATVYSHLTAGHTTRNFAAVVFGKEAGENNGIHMFSLLYPDGFAASEIDRLFPSMEAASKEKAKAIILKEMAEHYKNTTSREVSEIDPEFKGTSTNMGAEMFTDLSKSRSLFQEHWKNKWIALEANLKQLKGKLKKAALI